MTVDTSALLAILLNEPEAVDFSRLIYQADEARISVASVLEASMVLEGRYVARSLSLDEAIKRLELSVAAFDEPILALAREANRNFGRGRHPAGLNFGDCISFATAKFHLDALLFKGDDFGLTDIWPAAPRMR